jgi:hypothetical protein
VLPDNYDSNCAPRATCQEEIGDINRTLEDGDIRVFAACGSAVGFASAFRAPLAGVTFALEEAVSFFEQRVIFRMFLSMPSLRPPMHAEPRIFWSHQFSFAPALLQGLGAMHARPTASLECHECVRN